jgi:D-alanyl-D-alanine carboxypeptidase
MKTGSHEAAGGCLMFRAVWPAESGNRSLIGVVLGQRGDNLITAGLHAAKQLVDRLAPNASSTAGTSGRLSADQPGLARPAETYIARISKTTYAPATPRCLN